jgi:hypothetical protein
MTKNSRNPIYDPSKLVTKDGEILTPKYLTGNPLNYRLDMGKGVLNFEGQENLTKAAKPFKVLPIAFRCLEGVLFGNPSKKWAEVYFINEKKQLGMFMFHGFSVEQLAQSTRILQYDDGKLTEAVWTISFVEKSNEANQKFYIADFDFEVLNEEKKLIWEGVRDNILQKYFHIYRDNTRKLTTRFQENWSDGLVPNSYELAAELAREKAMLAQFKERQKAETEPKPQGSKA